MEIKHRKTLIVLVILNAIATLAALIWPFLAFVGWHIGFFYGNREHIAPERLTQIKETVADLIKTGLIPVGVTSLIWFVIACFMLAKSKNALTQVN